MNLPPRLPDFFIVGAARAGTSCLWRWLQQHPDVFMPDEKEPSHFCHELTPWAPLYKDRDAYAALFAGRPEKAIGEASIAYLACPESPGLIRQACPDARIITILRSPAERLFSGYGFLCRYGLEWLYPFEKAVAAEPTRQRLGEQTGNCYGFWPRAFLYQGGGRYAEAVQRYIDTFPKEQLLWLLYDDLCADPAATLEQICQFLDVQPPDTPRMSRTNESAFPLSTRLQFALARLDKSYYLLHGKRKPDLWDRGCKKLMGINRRLGRLRTVTLAPETRAMLQEECHDDIIATGKLIGKDLSAWLIPR